MNTRSFTFTAAMITLLVSLLFYPALTTVIVLGLAIGWLIGQLLVPALISLTHPRR